jgi:hypothetical protein
VHYYYSFLSHQDHQLPVCLELFFTLNFEIPLPLLTVLQNILYKKSIMYMFQLKPFYLKYNLNKMTLKTRGGKGPKSLA